MSFINAPKRTKRFAEPVFQHRVVNNKCSRCGRTGVALEERKLTTSTVLAFCGECVQLFDTGRPQESTHSPNEGCLSSRARIRQRQSMADALAAFRSEASVVVIPGSAEDEAARDEFNYRQDLGTYLFLLSQMGRYDKCSCKRRTFVHDRFDRAIRASKRGDFPRRQDWWSMPDEVEQGLCELTDDLLMIKGRVVKYEVDESKSEIAFTFDKK